MNPEAVTFKIKDGEVVDDVNSWIYIWLRLESNQPIIKIGATWLHPAARAEKHLRKNETEAAMVKAFAVPNNIDRQRVKKQLHQLFISKNLTLQLYSKSLSSSKDQKQTSEEESFVNFIFQDIFSILNANRG